MFHNTIFIIFLDRDVVIASVILTTEGGSVMKMTVNNLL